MNGRGVLVLVGLLGAAPGHAHPAAEAGPDVAGGPFATRHPAAEWRTTQRCASADAWEAVIRSHVARYPDLEAPDLYKLLHQGVMGSEHAVPSAEAASRWLDDEISSMGTGPDEPLVDTIAPGGAHVRIHLRPFVQGGGDPAGLLSAFVRTANAAAGSEAALTCALRAASTMARDGRISLDHEELAGYFRRQRAEGYPAVHHSEAFTARYRPAYRVVGGGMLTEALGGGG